MTWEDFRPNRSLTVADVRHKTHSTPFYKKLRRLISRINMVYVIIGLVVVAFWGWLVYHNLSLREPDVYHSEKASLKQSIDSDEFFTTSAPVSMTARCDCYFQVFTFEPDRKIVGITTEDFLSDESREFRLPSDQTWMVLPGELWFVSTVENDPTDVKFTFKSDQEDFTLTVRKQESELADSVTTSCLVAILLPIATIFLLAVLFSD